jgi:hypothetical protein
VYDRVGETVATIDPLLNRTSFVFDGVRSVRSYEKQHRAALGDSRSVGSSKMLLLKTAFFRETAGD